MAGRYIYRFLKFVIIVDYLHLNAWKFQKIKTINLFGKLRTFVSNVALAEFCAKWIRLKQGPGVHSSSWNIRVSKYQIFNEEFEYVGENFQTSKFRISIFWAS